MNTFGFTQKKFVSLRPETRHAHIIEWLIGYYQKLTTNRFDETTLDEFSTQYQNILSWTDMAPFTKPDTINTLLWIETVSDRIHYHRSNVSDRLRDYDLLSSLKMGDHVLAPEYGDQNCHVALDGLRSVFNVGSIFRTCDAAGISSVILGNTPGKNHHGIKKTAMDTQKWLPQETTRDLARLLMKKKDAGFAVMGVEIVEDALPYYAFPWQPNTILVFGNEEYGISSHVRQICDAFIYIPMFGRKNSINVASAVSVVCFNMMTALLPRIESHGAQRTG